MIRFGFSIPPGAPAGVGDEVALGVRAYFQRRFTFAGTPDDVEEQVRSAIAAGATQFDGAIDAPLSEHRERITRWAELVMSRFGPRHLRIRDDC